jgi:hypothetical protein
MLTTEAPSTAQSGSYDPIRYLLIEERLQKAPSGLIRQTAGRTANLL